MQNTGDYFQTIKNSSVAEQVMEQLTNAIINRELKPGDKIPTEAELCQKFGVGRNSIREATKILVSYGILETRRAEGTFVKSGFSDTMLNPLLYGIILENGSVKNLVDFRRIIEVGSGTLAIENANAEDLELMKIRLDQLCGSLRQPYPDPKVVLEQDCAFHVALEKSVHNPLLTMISNMLTTITKYSRLRTIEVLLENQDPDYLIKTHTDLYNSIKNRDLQANSIAVENSFKHWSIVMEKEKPLE